MVGARLQQGAIIQPVASNHDPSRGQFTVRGGLVGGEKTSYSRSGGLWYHGILNTLTKEPPWPFSNQLGRSISVQSVCDSKWNLCMAHCLAWATGIEGECDVREAMCFCSVWDLYSDKTVTQGGDAHTAILY
jgi:hypothetical protein